MKLLYFLQKGGFSFLHFFYFLKKILNQYPACRLGEWYLGPTHINDNRNASENLFCVKNQEEVSVLPGLFCYYQIFF